MIPPLHSPLQTKQLLPQFKIKSIKKPQPITQKLQQINATLIHPGPFRDTTLPPTRTDIFGINVVAVKLTITKNKNVISNQLSYSKIQHLINFHTIRINFTIRFLFSSDVFCSLATVSVLQNGFSCCPPWFLFPLQFLSPSNPVSVLRLSIIASKQVSKKSAITLFQ